MGVNIPKFLSELAAAGLPVLGLRPIGLAGIVAEDVMFDFAPQATAAERDQAEQLKIAHDPIDYKALVRDGSESQISAIPEWAHWTIAQFLSWHNTNIKTPLANAPTVTTQNAVAVLNSLIPILVKIAAEQEALGQLSIALRNKEFPNLQI